MFVLFKKHSTRTQEKVLSNTFSPTALDIYKKFESSKALVNMNLQMLTNFFIKKERTSFLISF